jgi:hypothetical protein
MPERPDDKNRAKIVQELLDALEQGEEISVHREGDRLEITTVKPNKCQDNHPRLYGRLLSINEQLSGAGCGVIVYTLLACALFCLGIHLQWWDKIIGQEIMEPVRSIWFYVLFMGAAYALLQTLSHQLEKGVYWRHRGELLALLAAEGLQRDVLISMIADDPKLARVAEHLKLDHDAAPDPS